MTGGFCGKITNQVLMRQRERERERAEEAVCGRLHLQEPLKRTAGQLTGDD